MNINIKPDSDNFMHMVIDQQQAAYCAVASFMMARNQAKQQSHMESEWELAWNMYYQVVRSMDIIPKEPFPMTYGPGQQLRMNQT